MKCIDPRCQQQDPTVEDDNIFHLAFFGYGVVYAIWINNKIQYVGSTMARFGSPLAKKHRRSLKALALVDRARPLEALYQAMADKRLAQHTVRQSKIGRALRAAKEGTVSVTVMYSYSRISRMSLFVLEGQTIRCLLPQECVSGPHCQKGYL